VLPSDDELVSRSVDLAAELAERARVLGGPSERRRQRRLRRLLSSPTGARLVFALADRVLRPVDASTAAVQLGALTAGPVEGLSATDRGLLRLAGAAARAAPFPVVALVRARLRYETRSLVYPAQPLLLGRRLAAVRGRPNLNLLGEAVLGQREARRRLAAVESLLARPDVDCVSVKVSAIAAGLSLADFEGSVERISRPLQELYQVVAAGPVPKLVNLDMEEHRDLDLTVESFTRCLAAPQLSGLRAGIALQAYLPDSHEAVDRLQRFAEERVRSGGAPVRVRLVKGANLAMETTTAELACWPQPTYEAKAETDASYKALLVRLLEAAGGGAVEVGVATHNLFDVAFALVLSEALGVTVDIEMLAGMADDQAAAVAERTSRVLLYTPVVTRKDFRNALAYLARRLDENATPDGYLRHALELAPGSAAWETESGRFAEAVRARHDVRVERAQRQDRLREVGEVGRRRGGSSGVRSRGGPWGPGPAPEPLSQTGGFANAPATDLTVPANRQWAVDVLSRPPPPAPTPVSSEAEVVTAVVRARSAAAAWDGLGANKRAEILTGAAEVMAVGRGDAVAVMASEAGKTLEEADPEVSEGVDYARWYGAGAGSLRQLLSEVGGEAESEPLGVVVVAPPWNFPYAIPAGGALAALAAGNAVVLKPAPEARATSAVLVSQLHGAGIDDGVLQFLPAEDGPAGRLLVTHPEVGGVVLTGSYQTARLFLGWAPRRRLLAETSGKNSVIVSATADVDQAVRDVVTSAFGHAGQKCSAASLAIVVAPLYDRSPFLRQLADAVKSLRVGPATDPATQVGPIVGPFTEALERALTQLGPGESWLVQPARLDGAGPGAAGRLWSPGVRTGVRPGSSAHTTEWFGPVLGVMRAASFEQALAWQNAVPYGLTAGLSSLDPVEHRRWADGVEAGNLYVNRTTTGAIVGRQPFGGWKRSSVGPTAKAGGPNYLIGLRRWRDAAPVSTEEALVGYRRWWDRHFGRSTELAGLASESNELRYRPFAPGVIVRAGADVPDEELRKAVGLSELTGTPVSFSVPGARPGLGLGGRTGVELGGRGGDRQVVESAGSFAASLARRRGSGARLRLLGEAEQVVAEAAAEAGLNVLDEPICSCGRVELVRWLREQVVTRSLHRYGNVVYSRW
jgi:RHH-type transcriptional regulator, proline utilization regulon repressor / proline dehydrogenase / delta 1-pyrroline-5-carboxylate dehydrogenase